MTKFFGIFVALLSLACVHGFAIQPKIVNGIISNPSDFKYFAAIRTSSSMCSGVLISDKWVLTAAHCLMRNQTLVVSIGLKKNDDYVVYNEHIVVMKANQHMHPGFIGQIFCEHDIGLLELPTPVRQSPFVEPVKLSTDCGAGLNNIDVVAIGNGVTSMVERRKDAFLRHVYLKTMSLKECADRMEEHGWDNDALCAEPNSDGGHVYEGDSGGPMMKKSDDSLIGVGSFGDGTVNPPDFKMQVYTRVYPYYKWISEMTGIDTPVCDN